MDHARIVTGDLGRDGAAKFSQVVIGANVLR
jgi:hypothetical protein